MTKDFVDEQIGEYKEYDEAKEQQEYSKIYQKIADISAGGGTDLSPYLKKDEAAATYATKSEIPEPVDLTDYAKKSDIPDVTNFATKNEIPDVTNFATKDEIPDVSNFATKDEIPSIDGLATKEEVETVE